MSPREWVGQLLHICSTEHAIVLKIGLYDQAQSCVRHDIVCAVLADNAAYTP
jgi:hypothetical protein